jgi:WD40 repeat protein
VRIRKLGLVALFGLAATCLLIVGTVVALRWNTAPGKVITLLEHTDGILSLTFSPDGRFLASASADHTVRVWDTAQLTPLRTLGPYSGLVWAVAFSPGGDYLAVATDADEVATRNSVSVTPSGGRKALVYDTSNWEVVANLHGHDLMVDALAFTPNGQHLATSGCDRVVLWDVATWQEEKQFETGNQHQRGLTFSPDGRMFVGGDFLDNVRGWEVATGKECLALLGHDSFVTSLAFSPDGHLLASGSQDETVKIWDLGSRCELTTLRCFDEVTSVAISPDGTLLAAGDICDGLHSLYDTGVVHLWDLATRRKLAILRGASRGPRALAFSPNCGTLAIGDDDGALRLWHLRSN